SVQRRAPIVSAGGVPTDSITEDLLSSLVLLRQGYVTRYLNEKLSMGLAPENLKGFFRQRERWCRGNLQTLYLKTGPLGPGLTLWQRLLFLPLDWVISYVTRLMAIFVPILYLWTGVGPFLIPSLGELLFYQVPVFVALLGVMRWLAPNSFYPVLTTASSLFGSFRIVPAALATLVKPFGTPFKVTPKGSGITFSFGDSLVLGAAVGLMALTVGGLVTNRLWPTDPGGDGAFRLVAEVWALVNVFLLAVGALIPPQMPRPRQEGRFPVAPPAAGGPGGAAAPCRVLDLSASGARLAGEGLPPVGAALALTIDGIGTLPARVARPTANGAAVCFEGLAGADSDRLIHALYGAGRTN